MTEVDILARLYAAKRVALEKEREREPLDKITARAETLIAARRPFREALLSSRGPAIVAEIKRASPSRGLIVREMDAAEVARRYASAGADALSVLTETDHFLGDLSYLEQAREATALPILRKDFLNDPYQVVQSAAYGADAILAILAGIDDTTLAMLLADARRWKLDVLVEIHDESELQRALKAGATLLGINTRDLRTFETNLAIAAELLPLIPPSVLAISESGIHSADDTRELVASGARGFLIGETLMRAENPAELIGAIKAGAAASAFR